MHDGSWSGGVEESALVHIEFPAVAATTVSFFGEKCHSILRINESGSRGEADGRPSLFFGCLSVFVLHGVFRCRSNLPSKKGTSWLRE